METTRLERLLYDFLMKTFTNEELLLVLRYAPRGRELVDDLPAASEPRARFIDQALAALERRNMIAADFFELLIQARPGWRAEIVELAGLWEIQVPSQSSPTPTRVPNALGEIPPGPGVPTVEVSEPLIEAFSEIASDADLVELTINKAIALRRSYESHASVIRMFELPNPDRSIRSFWKAALYQACKHGPPMLAALLLTLPEHLLAEPARADRDRLLTRLRDRKYRDDLTAAS
jgi:hypothetical protein